MATQAEILTSMEAQRTALLAIATDVQDISDSIDENPPADLTPIAESVAQTDQVITDLTSQVKAVVAKFPSDEV